MAAKAVLGRAPPGDLGGLYVMCYVRFLLLVFRQGLSNCLLLYFLGLFVFSWKPVSFFELCCSPVFFRSQYIQVYHCLRITPYPINVNCIWPSITFLSFRNIKSHFWAASQISKTQYYICRCQGYIDVKDHALRASKKASPNIYTRSGCLPYSLPIQLNYSNH